MDLPGPLQFPFVNRVVIAPNVNAAGKPFMRRMLITSIQFVSPNPGVQCQTYGLPPRIPQVLMTSQATVASFP